MDEDETWLPEPMEIGLRYEPEIDCVVQFDADTGHEMRVEPCEGNDPHTVADDELMVGRWS